MQRTQISKYTIYLILLTENLLMPEIFLFELRTVVLLIDLSISVCNYEEGPQIQLYITIGA